MKIAQSAVVLTGVLVLAVTSCSTAPKCKMCQAAKAGYPTQNLVQYAKPMCGTGTFPKVPAGDNNLFPGAVMPFGMIQWSPDTGAGTTPGGYKYFNTEISGFSLDHVSGAGCPDGGNFSFMPLVGTYEPPNGRRTAFAAAFSHTNEMATPGYYAVTLNNGVKVELTATTRTGFGRFTWPAGKSATLAINAASDVNHSDASDININPDTHEITGWSIGGYFCQSKSRERDKRTIYFCAEFDKPFSGYGTWSGAAYAPKATNGNDTASGAFLTFDTSKSSTVLAKVAISYVSIANARANIEAENPGKMTTKVFDHTAKYAGEVWNDWLNKVQVTGGTTTDLETFYSMLYHAFIGPTTCSDANGDYTGYDGQVHNAGSHVQYANFSGWDIYRSEAQLLGLLAPKEASDMAQSLLNDYTQGGAFPRWGVITEDSGVMMGDPAAAIVADYYAFGATNFDTQGALAGLLNAATNPAVYAPLTKTHERDGLGSYLKLGYIPNNGQEGGYGPVSMVQEYDSADFALSQFAASLGDDTDSAMLLQHAQDWRNLYNPQTGYLQLRETNGDWTPGFTNNVGTYGPPAREKPNKETIYVEGTAGQYLWMEPFNYKGLADLMGGRDEAVKRLDAFFTELNAGDRGTNAWMAWLGNEPCLETPWIYDFWGAPYKTQDVVRRAMIELYTNAPASYPGNDDLGEMSSWYIFSALGMYPELPGSDILVIGSPLFPKAVVHLQSGDITITANGAADNAPYVQSLTVNGQAWDKTWVRLSDIRKGGTMVYNLNSTPNTSWGSDPSDAPPSYDGGMK